MANPIESFESSPIYQLLTVIALLGSLWLMWRGFSTESPSNRGGFAPKAISPGQNLRQSSREAYCNLNECCLSLQIGSRITPLAADYLCCGTQGTNLHRAATRPTKTPTGQPVNLGAFSEASGCDYCCDASTVTQIGIGKNVSVSPTPEKVQL